MTAPAATAEVWKSYLALLFGTFVTIEAAAFQAPAMPSVAKHFGIPINLAALILLLYFLGLTVFAPIMGRVADQRGRKRVLMAGLVLFAGSEFLAAWAPNFPVFLAARFLQGLGVACILPGVLAYVTHLFPEERRGAALGILTLAMTFGAASGGLLGGLLIDHLGWPSVYWVSGVLALLGLLPVALKVPEVRTATKPAPFDLAGAACLFLTIASLLSFPTWVGRYGFASPPALAALLLGLTGLALLWRIGRQAPAPVVDTALLSRRAFALPGAIYWLNLICFSAVVYTLAFFLSGRPGGNASQVGFVSLFLYGGSMLAAPLSGRVVDRVAPHYVVFFALGGTLAALALFVNIRAETPLWQIIVVASLLGLMMGTNTPAIMKLAMGAVPRERMGAGAGLFSMFRDLGAPTGSSFALAVFGSTLVTQTLAAAQAQARRLGVGEHFLPALDAAVASKGQSVEPALREHLAGLGVGLDDVLRQAGSEGLSAALPSVGYLLMGMVAMTLALSLFLRPPRK